MFRYEQLPFVDEHSITLDRPPEQVWDALQRTAPSTGFHVTESTAPSKLVLEGRHPFSRYALVFLIEPREGDGSRTGDGGGARVGAGGGAQVRAGGGARVRAGGGTRVGPGGGRPDGHDGGSRARAQTWAAFPGPHGRVYRALVIGSGIHAVLVRRMLRRLA
jgi:hypothetical protein